MAQDGRRKPLMKAAGIQMERQTEICIGNSTETIFDHIVHMPGLRVVGSLKTGFLKEMSSQANTCFL